MKFLHDRHRFQRYLPSASLIGLIVALASCGPTTVSTPAKRAASLTRLEQKRASEPAAQLQQHIQSVLDRELKHRVLDTKVNAAWQIIHGVVAYGDSLTIRTPDEGVVGALDYAFRGGPINGFDLSLGKEPLKATNRTGIVARIQPGSYTGQGHVDQWIGYFAMAGVPADKEIIVQGEKRTVMDLARQAQYDVWNAPIDEFSWTLMALTHYLPDEPKWIAADNSELSWELLVEAELTFAINDSPCGGGHRLCGLAKALNAKKRLGLPDSNVWTRCQQVVDQYIEVAKSQRSSNGGLSSHFFVRPGATSDLAAELSSAGHIFEFLAVALPTDQLREPWVEIAADRICTLLDLLEDQELECGGLYHALSGLRIYRDRRFAENVAQN